MINVLIKTVIKSGKKTSNTCEKFGCLGRRRGNIINHQTRTARFDLISAALKYFRFPLTRTRTIESATNLPFTNQDE